MAEPHTYAQFLEDARRFKPRVAVILGSGLSLVAKGLTPVCQVPYGAVPNLESPTVAGHQGSLLLAKRAGQGVLIFAGRLHYYEGHPWRRVVEPIHVARRLGVATLLVTNAAGGIHADLSAGSLMALEAHLDCTRPFPWSRRHAPYSPRLLELLVEAAQTADISLPRGVYAQVTGPCYETPAEIRALRAAGADAVGMSTAREIEVALSLGLECAALSCITNRAAGLSDGPINHEEVLASSRAQCQCLNDLLERFLRLLP